MAKLNSEVGIKILDAFDSRAIKIAKEKVRTSPFNKTKFGIITAKSGTKYTVKIENVEYKNIKAIRNAGLINVNDVVTCLVPNNNMSNIFILGVVDGEQLEYLYTTGNQSISGNKKFLDTVYAEKIKGRNWININAYAEYNQTGNVSVSNGVLTYKRTNGGAYSGARYTLKLTPNATYTLSFTRLQNNAYYRIEGDLPVTISSTDTVKTFTTTGENITITFTEIVFNQTEFKVGSLQLELGSTATPYTPYIGDYITSESFARGLTYFDTRNDNSPPSYYLGTRSFFFEFKTKSTIAVNTLLTSTTSPYCSLETYTRWIGSLGGYPIQIARDGNQSVVRYGTGSTTWSSWKELVIKNNIEWLPQAGLSPYIGFDTGSSDGTFVMSIQGTSYTTGLAIGGTSKNLIWKGNKVLAPPSFSSGTSGSITLPSAGSYEFYGTDITRMSFGIVNWNGSSRTYCPIVYQNTTTSGRLSIEADGSVYYSQLSFVSGTTGYVISAVTTTLYFRKID